MLWVLFFATAPFFWTWFVILSLMMIVTLENESPYWATISFLVSFVFLCLFSDFVSKYQILQYLTLYNIILFAVGYTVIGVSYSFLKWYLFLIHKREKLVTILHDYRKYKNISSDQPIDTNSKDFQDYISSLPGYYYSKQPYKVIPVPNKSIIVSWITYWPWSLITTLLDDFILEFFNIVYMHILHSYERLAAWVFKDIVK